MSASVNLQALKVRIERETAREVWFYPRVLGVKGWEGTGRIMFVGLNPSTGRFPSRADNVLYERLGEYGFENAHLSDAIKCRAKSKEVDGWRSQPDHMGFVQTQLGYLREELKILDPALVVPFGPKCYQLLMAMPEMLGRMKVVLPHYSPRIPSSAATQKLRAGFARLRSLADEG